MSKLVPFSLTELVDGKLVILSVTGNIMGGEGDDAICKAVQSIIAAKTTEEGAVSAAILDLSQCIYVDSMGLGEIARSYTNLKREGITLVLAGVPGRVKDLLVITKLHCIFDIYTTVDQAKARIAR